MMPILHLPGAMIPGQLGPRNRVISALWNNRIFFRNLQNFVHPTGGGGHPRMLKGRGETGEMYKVL